MCWYMFKYVKYIKLNKFEYHNGPRLKNYQWNKKNYNETFNYVDWQHDGGWKSVHLHKFMGEGRWGRGSKFIHGLGWVAANILT